MGDKNKRELATNEIWMYAIGFFGIMLLLTTFNTFSYNYVIYVIGLDPYLASIGTSIGLIFMAFSGPIFGYVSDRIKLTKYGRRRPFLLFGAPLLITFFIGLWIFPIKCDFPGQKNWGVAIYYWIFCVLFCVTYQAIWAPYMAMLPEVSETEENRIAIASSQGLFNLVATVVGLLLPFLLLSGIEDPQNALFYQTEGGQKLMDQMLIVALAFSALCIGALYITFFQIKEPCVEGISKEELKEIQCEDTPEKQSIKEVLNDFISPVRNKDFAMWSGTNFIVNFALRLPMTILMAFMTFVLEVEGLTMIYFILGVVPFVGGGFFLWQKFSKKYGLKKTYQTVVSLMVITMVSAAIFLLKPDRSTRLVVGFIMVVVIVSILVALFILPNPITSKIIDNEIIDITENTMDPDNLDQYKVSGRFFGVNSFTFNLSGAISFQILGFILGRGGTENYYTIALMLPITGIIAFFALFSARNMTLKKRQKATKKDYLLILGLVVIAIAVVLSLAIFI